MSEKTSIVRVRARPGSWLSIPIGCRASAPVTVTSGQGPYAAVIDIIGVAKSAKESRG